MSAPTLSFGLFDDADALIRTFHLQFSKFDATAAPAVGNDDSQGYVAGSWWIDRTAHKAYICKDNATGAAVWSEVPGSGGGGGMANPMTTTGDIIYSSDNSGTPERLAFAGDGQILIGSLGLPAWSGASLTFSTSAGLNASNGSYTATLAASTGPAGSFTDGTRTVSLCDGTNHITYTPATSGDWASPPTDVWVALDTLAAIAPGGIVSLANGGTEASLTDPGADSLLGWDDTDDAIGFWTIGTGLSYDHATHTLSSTGGSGTVGGNGTDNHIARWNGTDDIQDSGVVIDDSNNVTGMTTLTLPPSGLHILDSDLSHVMIVQCQSDLTADRILFIQIGDANRTIILGGDFTTAGTFNVSGTFASTLTLTGATNVTLPTGGVLATLAGTEALTNKTYNGNAWTAGTGTLTLAAGKVFTVSNTLTFTGTDGSSVVFGAGGTVAYLASPGFTGVPTAPTATAGTNTTQIATTAYVTTAISNSTQTITLTGDVTGSGTGSFATTIAANVVTLAMQATVATTSFLGRNTAGTGNQEVLSVLTAKTMLGLTGTNSGDQTITLTGDVTGSGTGSFAATIAALAVTTAKIAANAVTSAKVDSTVIIAAGTNPFSGDQSMGLHKLTDVTDPTAAQDAATKNYVDVAVAALAEHPEVKCATAAALTEMSYTNNGGVGDLLTLVAGVVLIDGQTLTVADRVLIKNQANSAHNGIWVVQTVGIIGVSTVFVRATDFDQESDGVAGALVFVLNGTANDDTRWECSTSGVITWGTTNLNWSQFLGGVYTADESTLHLSGTTFSIISTYVGQTSITTLGTITTGDWNGTPVEPTYGGVPTGGTAAQVLSKIDGTDYNAEWVTNPSNPQPNIAARMWMGF